MDADVNRQQRDELLAEMADRPTLSEPARARLHRALRRPLSDRAVTSSREWLAQLYPQYGRS